jgi:hypothetical protein
MRTVGALLAGLFLVGGCKHPDDGPRPFVFPAYPVQNLPPAPSELQKLQPVPSKTPPPLAPLPLSQPPRTLPDQ